MLRRHQQVKGRQAVFFLTVATLGAVVLPNPARACGYWFLEDDEQKVRVTFLARGIETIPQAAAPTESKKPLGWFIHDVFPICQRVRSDKMDVRDGVFRKGRAVKARLSGTTLEFGARQFEITLQPITDTKGRNDIIRDPELPYWDVKVTSDGKTVAHGPAMSFVTCSGAGHAHKETEIRERVACYLVLRGKGLPLPAGPSPGRSRKMGR